MPLRRTLALAATLAATAPLAHAQRADDLDTPVRGGPQLGLVLGANFASLAGRDVASDDRKTGLVFGLSVLVPVHTRFALQPELHYSQKGSQVGGGGETIRLNLDYVDVPLLVRWQVPTAGAFRPFVVAGPNVAWQARCNVSVGSGRGNAPCDAGLADENGTPATFRRIDYGAVVGAGIDFPFGGQDASLSARYGVGLADVTDGANARNRAIQLLFGVRF